MWFTRDLYRQHHLVSRSRKLSLFHCLHGHLPRFFPFGGSVSRTWDALSTWVNLIHQPGTQWNVWLGRLYIYCDGPFCFFLFVCFSSLQTIRTKWFAVALNVRHHIVSHCPARLFSYCTSLQIRLSFVVCLEERDLYDSILPARVSRSSRRSFHSIRKRRLIPDSIQQGTCV